jgi:hypothetical protein
MGNFEKMNSHDKTPYRLEREYSEGFDKVPDMKSIHEHEFGQTEKFPKYSHIVQCTSCGIMMCNLCGKAIDPTAYTVSLHVSMKCTAE